MRMWTLIVMAVLLCCLMVSGCEMETRVVRSSWDNLPADPKPSQQPDAYNDAAGGQGWSIRIAQVKGRDRYGQAQVLIKELRATTNVADLWIQDAGDTVSVYQGRYATATDPAIRPIIGKLKDVQINDDKPFADARIVPLVGGSKVIADPFDLRQFTGYYTLQIGFYDNNYDGDFRAAAEEAVRALREEGEEAYYYHGPFRSIITIGVFTYDEAFVHAGTYDTYSPRVRELQKRFPYNLGNGVTLIQKENGKNIGEQKSSLVRVS